MRNAEWKNAWLLAGVWLVLGSSGLAGAETANRIVAVVNDDVITEADVASRAADLLEARPPKGGDTPDPADVQQAILRRLIEQRLILQEAKRLDISVSADEVADRLDKIQKKFDSEDAFAEALSKSGLTREELREQIRQQLLADRLIGAQVRSTIAVSPQEVAEVLAQHPELAKGGDRVRASHILVRVSDARSEEEARRGIESLHRRLEAGEDFAALAQQFSEDPQAKSGGLLGWVAKSELLPELDQALFSLQPGQVSAPIKTRLGFHLLRAEEQRSAAKLPLLEANTAVYQQIYEAKFKAAFQKWLSELTRKAYIEIIPAQGPPG